MVFNKAANGGRAKNFKMTVVKESIIEEFYGFIKYLLPIVDKFPRSQKFILGDRISNKVLDIHEMYIEAYYSSKEVKKGVLVKINLMLEQLRYLIRLSFDWHYINHKRYEYIMGLLLELGKKTGAWINSIK